MRYIQDRLHAGDDNPPFLSCMHWDAIQLPAMHQNHGRQSIARYSRMALSLITLSNHLPLHVWTGGRHRTRIHHVCLPTLTADRVGRMLRSATNMNGVDLGVKFGHLLLHQARITLVNLTVFYMCGFEPPVQCTGQRCVCMYMVFTF